MYRAIDDRWIKITRDQPQEPIKLLKGGCTAESHHLQIAVKPEENRIKPYIKEEDEALEWE